jgi:hypothetical protein
MRTPSLCTAVLLIFAVTSLAAERAGESWTEGVSYTPMPGQHHPPFETIGWGSDGSQLFGLLIYKYRRYPDDSPPATLHGKQRDDWFWPNVTFQVSCSWRGPWKTIGRSRQGRETLGIDRARGYAGLKTDLDVFKPYIGKLECGRIVVESGEAATLDINNLVPPSQRRERNK